MFKRGFERTQKTEQGLQLSSLYHEATSAWFLPGCIHIWTLSTAIHQRLLEEVTLTIDTVYEKARSLVVAQRNSEAYDSVWNVCFSGNCIW